MSYFSRFFISQKRVFGASLCCSLALCWKSDLIEKNKNYFLQQCFFKSSFAESNEYVTNERIPYLIVGAGVSGYSAATTILSSDDKAKVLLVTKERYKPYIRSYIPRLLKDLKKIDINALKHGINEELFLLDTFETSVPIDHLFENDNASMSLLLGKEVVFLDTDRREVLLSDGRAIKFKKILFATGEYPKRLDIFNYSEKEIQERIFHLYDVEDLVRFCEHISESNREITILGDNPYSLDIVTNLYSDHKITIICNGSRFMEDYIPSYLSEDIKKQFEKLGINVITGLDVEATGYSENQAYLYLEDSSVVSCDVIIDLHGWIKPVPFAKDNNCKGNACLTKYNEEGYKVNAYLQSGGRDIYVAGSAGVSYDPYLPGYRKIKSLDHSISSGEFAALNITEKQSIIYDYQSHLTVRLPESVVYKYYGAVDPSLDTVSIWEKLEENENHYSKKGVIFYVKDDYIDAILTCNIPDVSSLADGILRAKMFSVDYKELAKYFFEEKDSSE